MSRRERDDTRVADDDPPRRGALRLDGGGMFGVVPRAMWSRLTEPDDENRIALQTNCVLLDDGERRVLIETGFGDKWSDKERGFYALERRTVLDALRDANVDPASITDVVLTHLHFDHAAGLTQLGADGAPESCFPDARIHVQRREWDDAVANKSVMTRTYLRSHLDPIADQLVFASGPTEVIPGIHVDVAPGHTWGHQVVRFDDGHGTDLLRRRRHADRQPRASLRSRWATTSRRTPTCSPASRSSTTRWSTVNASSSTTNRAPRSCARNATTAVV